mgnify:CR=1 FL=1
MGLHTEKRIAPFVATQIFYLPIGNAKRRTRFYQNKNTFPIRKSTIDLCGNIILSQPFQNFNTFPAIPPPPNVPLSTQKAARADLRYLRGQPAKPHTSARHAPRRGANGCAAVRFLTCALVQPSIFRPQAALGSGFTLQDAFWYQNAMLALFLRSKKSLMYSPSPEL